MTTIGYIIVILGAASFSVDLMRLIERVDRPSRHRRRRMA